MSEIAPILASRSRYSETALMSIGSNSALTASRISVTVRTPSMKGHAFYWSASTNRETRSRAAVMSPTTYFSTRFRPIFVLSPILLAVTL